VSSWIKPDAKTEELVGTIEKDFKCLGKSDVIIISGGANDVSSMRTQTISAVGKMTRFVQKYSNTNIIIVNTPHRHDLDRTSVVNSQIHAFNRQLFKVVKAYSHVTIVETDLDRKLSTRHGMHLNKRGKEWLSKLLAMQISRLVINKVRDTPKIALKWKDESAVNQYPEIHMTSMSPPDQTNSTNSKTQIDTLYKQTVVPRTSTRQKRLLITHNKDFLWKLTSHSHKLPIPQITKESGPKLTKKLNTNCRIPLTIYHQNIRGLRCKTNELIGHFHPVLPKILHFTEHHMHWEEL
jgi:hypothetical protein